MSKSTGKALVTAAVVLLVIGGSSMASATRTSSAQGAGHVRIEGELRSFSFNARQLGNGVVTGQAQLNARQADHWVHLELDCLEVSGSTAYMSGVVTNSNLSFLIGLTGVFSVTDNGEGKGSADLISSLEPTTSDCRLDKRPPDRSIEMGNIQVN